MKNVFLLGLTFSITSLGLLANAQSAGSCGPGDYGIKEFQNFQIVSTDSNGVQANDQSTQASISANGRYVVFRSNASLFAGTSSDPNPQIYRKDLLTNELLLVSPSMNGGPSNNQSYKPIISADGSKVAFVSNASDLTSDVVSNARNVFVYDVPAGTMTLINKSNSGELANHVSRYELAFSSDGSKLVFSTQADNLSGDAQDAFLRSYIADLDTGSIIFITPGYAAAVSSNGNHSSREVAFSSSETTLVHARGFGTGISGRHIVVEDLLNGTSEFLTLTPSGIPSDAFCNFPMFADNDDLVMFVCDNDDLIADDLDNDDDVFVYTRSTGNLKMVSRTNLGDGASYDVNEASISPDGSMVAFISNDRDHEAPVSKSGKHLYIRNLIRNETVLVTVPYNGSSLSGTTFLERFSWSADSNKLVFSSRVNDIVPNDTNGGKTDVFVVDVIDVCPMP